MSIHISRYYKKYLEVAFNLKDNCRIFISYKPDNILYSIYIFDNNKNNRYTLMIFWLYQNYNGRFIDFDFHVNPPRGR